VTHVTSTIERKLTSVLGRVSGTRLRRKTESGNGNGEINLGTTGSPG
jgi:hypothetical protein